MNCFFSLAVFRSISACSVLLLFTSGCASSLVEVSSTEGEGYTVLSGTAATRYAFIREGTSAKSICSEPTTDVAVDEGGGLSLSLAIVNNNDNADGGLEASEVSLGGRSVNVLLTREILFRTCEFIANSKLTDAEKIDIFKTTLQAVTTINKTNLGPGSINNASPQTIENIGPVPSGNPVSVATD